MPAYRGVGALFCTVLLALSFDPGLPDQAPAAPQPPEEPALVAPAVDYSADLALWEADEMADDLPILPAPDPFEGLSEAEREALIATEAVAAPDEPSPREPASGAAPLMQEPKAEPVRPVGPILATTGDIMATAQSLLGVPYLWGGNTTAGMDCSAYVSRAWGVSRQTTDTLHRVSYPVTKEELLPGDALNLTKREDPRGYGHVRLFAAWANDEHSRMWVYEETPPRVVYHVITYDPRYTPMRRMNFESDGVAPMIPAPAPVKRPSDRPQPGPSSPQEARPTRTPSPTRGRVAPTPTGSPQAPALLLAGEPAGTAAARSGNDRVRATSTTTANRRSDPANDQRSNVTATPTAAPENGATPAPPNQPRATRTPMPQIVRTATPTSTPSASRTPTVSPTRTPSATSTPKPVERAAAATSAPLSKTPTQIPTVAPPQDNPLPTATRTPPRRRR